MNLKIIFILLIGFLSGIVIGFSVQIKDVAENYLKNSSKKEEKIELPKPSNRPVKTMSVEQLFNIDTTVAREMELYKTIETYADIKHPETDLKDITFKIDGYVEKLYGDFTGKYVKKGQPLLTIYSPELVSAQEEFLRAYQYFTEMKNSKDKILKESAKQLYEAAYKKLKYWDITDSQIEELKKTKKVMKNITLFSPYDGWIMEKFVYLGSYVKAGKPVMRIAKHKNLWLIVKIYEKDIKYIKIGQKVMVNIESYPERTIKGKIDYIYPMMDEKTRTLNVRIVIDNKEGIFYPGMYGKVIIKVPLGKRTVLPETAVLDTGKRQIVFYEKEKGVFEPIFVKTGIYVDGYYEILEGVKKGMVVANSALFLLDADAQLKGKYRKVGEKTTPITHHHHH